MKQFTSFLRCAFLVFIGAALFGYVVLKAERGARVKGARDAVLFIAEFPDHVKEAYAELKDGNTSPYVTKAEQGECGVATRDSSFVDSNYVLASFFDPTIGEARIELIRIDDGEPIYGWTPPEKEIMERYTASGMPFVEYRRITHQNFLAIHPLLFDDGSVLFNLMYGPMVKIDKQSHIQWIIGDCFHHSLQQDADGNIWACLDEKMPRFDSLFSFKGQPFESNSIVKISPEGEVLFKKSVDDILLENNLAGLLYGAGEFENDPVHVNDIQPALSDSKYWKKGDLLISMRNKSTIFLYRPSENKITWLRQGPWIDQHDVNFVDSSHISLFGNDIVRLQGEEKYYPLRGNSNLYVIDMSCGQVTTPYEKLFNTQKLYNSFEGRGKILDNGLLFVEETYTGHLVIGNEKDILWSYSKCFPSGLVSSLGWCRYIPKDSLKLDFLAKQTL